MKTEIIAGLVVLAVGGMVAGAVWYTQRQSRMQEAPRAQPAPVLPAPVPESPKAAPAPSFESVIGGVSQGINALTGAFSAVFGAFA